MSLPSALTDREYQKFVQLFGHTAVTVANLNPVNINLQNGPNYLGDYDNAVNYVIGDVVSYLGSSYVAIQDTVGNLPTGASFWQLLAEKGEQGPQGIQGPQGDVGPQGIQGPQGDSGGIFEHVLLGETFVIQERTQALLIDKLRNEGKITVNGRLILRN